MAASKRHQKNKKKARKSRVAAKKAQIQVTAQATAHQQTDTASGSVSQSTVQGLRQALKGWVAQQALGAARQTTLPNTLRSSGEGQHPSRVGRFRQSLLHHRLRSGFRAHKASHPLPPARRQHLAKALQEHQETDLAASSARLYSNLVKHEASRSGAAPAKPLLTKVLQWVLPMPSVSPAMRVAAGVLLLALLLLAPVGLIGVLGLDQKLGKFMAYGVGLCITLAGVVGVRVAYRQPLVLVVALMHVLFLIFLEKKFLGRIGLDLKSYLMVFGVATLFSGVYLARWGKVLWQESWLFRGLLVFMVLTWGYLLLGYASDFRTNNAMMALSATDALKPGAVTNSQNTREFGAFSAYILWIDSIVPFVAVMMPLVWGQVLRQASAVVQATTVQWWARCFVTITAVHCVLALLVYLIGWSRTPLSFAGDVDPGCNFQFVTNSIVLLGLRYWNQVWQPNTPDIPQQTLLSRPMVWVLDYALLHTLIVGAGSVLSSGGSSMVAGFVMGIVLLVLGAARLGLDFPWLAAFKSQRLSDQWRLDLLKWVLMLLMVGGIVTGLVLQLSQGSQGDTSSFAMRLSHWGHIVEGMVKHLSLQTVVFGNGLDSVIELVYWASFSSPVEKGIRSPHNVYLGLFYNCGLCAFIYFVAVFQPLVHATKQYWGSSRLALQAFVGSLHPGRVLISGTTREANSQHVAITQRLLHEGSFQNSAHAAQSPGLAPLSLRGNAPFGFMLSGQVISLVQITFIVAHALMWFVLDVTQPLRISFFATLGILEALKGVYCQAPVFGFPVVANSHKQGVQPC